MPKQKNCIVCRGELYEVLDLGMMPSSNNLVTKAQLKTAKSFPLDYYSCSNCGLLQLTEFASSKTLFKNYLYLTGASKGLVQHFKEMSHDLGKIVKNKGSAYVIGSNDNTEVMLLKKSGFRSVIGIEPSNLGESKNNGFFTINKFFTYELSKELVKQYGRVDLVTANNVFAHIPNPKDMLMGMANLINKDGVVSIEVHWLKSIIEKLELETLYAEHFFVWSIKSMHLLANQVGLKVVDIIDMPNQHGGSLRFILKHSGREHIELQATEEFSGIYDTPKLVRTLQDRANNRRSKFINLISDIKKQGKTISIWSVPAKVPTLINFCKLTNKDIDYAYEVAPTKIGRYIPKANIFIKDEKLIKKDKPDYLIIGAWNYMDIALEKLHPYMKNGGRLINPLTCDLFPSKSDRIQVEEKYKNKENKPLL